MSTPNPYAAPKAAVADQTVVLSADFVPGGRIVAAGRGWSWVTAAWELFKRRPALWIGIGLLLLVILIVASLIPFLGSLLTMLFWPVFLGGVAIGCRALDEGRELEFAHLFAGFRERTGALLAVGGLYLGAFLVMLLVVVLVMGVGIFAMAGVGALLGMLVLLALTLPLVMAIWFAPPLVVFHDLGAVEAMKQSFFACLKNMVPFLVYGLVTLLLSILASIPLFLGWLVLWPVILITTYTGYRDIYFKPR